MRELLLAVDALEDVVYRARQVPLTDSVRVGRDVLDAAVARVQAAAAAEVGLVPGPELRAAIEELETVRKSARAIPLTSTVAVPKRRVHDALDRIRLSLPPGAAGDASRWEPLVAAIDELDERLRGARVVPLTPQVRLEGPELREAISFVRSRAGELFAADTPGAAPVSAVIGELERLVDAGTPVPLTSQIRVEPQPFHRQLDRLRAIVRAAAA